MASTKTPAKEAAGAAVRHYCVLKPLDVHMPGEFIKIGDDQVDKGVNEGRLVKLGAIEPIADPGEDVYVTFLGEPQNEDHWAPLPPAVPALPPTTTAKDGESGETESTS